MNGSQIKAVIDTNVIFMSLYNPQSKAGRIIQAALENKIKLYSTDSVKEEILRVLKRELDFSDEEIELIIINLPIIWVEKGVYEDFISQAKVKHKPDKPVEALSLVLNCGVLSANYHFKDRIDVDDFLKKIDNIEKIWNNKIIL